VPPAEAREFCDWLCAEGSLACGALQDKSFSVCALGDRCFTPSSDLQPASVVHCARPTGSPHARQQHGPACCGVCRSYEHFCACGKMLDARLEGLGGKRFVPRADVNRWGHTLVARRSI
jgi:sulfite reductase (NADPH) flavoprotein alpha-component